MRAETPLLPVFYPDVFEVVAFGGGEVEEVLRYGRRDGVVAFVFRPCSAPAVAVEAGGFVFEELVEGTADDCVC